MNYYPGDPLKLNVLQMIVLYSAGPSPDFVLNALHQSFLSVQQAFSMERRLGLYLSNKLVDELGPEYDCTSHNN